MAQNTARMPAFLKGIRQRQRFISCGTNNVYGHRIRKPWNVCKKRVPKFFVRMEDGTILVTIGKDGAMNIETMTERKPLYENIKEKLEKS